VELDLENTEFSRGVRRLQALVDQEAPFDHGREPMKVLAGLEVTTQSVERTAQAMGADSAQREQEEIPKASWICPSSSARPFPSSMCKWMGQASRVKKETVGRPGKTESQAAPTRAAKSGFVFTQTRWDQKGYPIRDPDSTTSTGAIETVEELGKRLFLEAWKPGWSRALIQVVRGDGAEGIWKVAARHFPGAILIVDLYHARQHLWKVVRKLYPQDRKPKGWMKVHQKGLLDKGKSKNSWGRYVPSHRATPK
jgi:hypothetical protein